MKKTVSLILVLTLLFGVFSVLTSCTPEEDPHEHTYADEWSFSSDTHWIASSCEHNLRKDEAAHSFDNPTFTSDGANVIYSCKVCGYMKSESHTHTFGNWETTKVPTIFEEGRQERSCKFVGCTAKESETLDTIAVTSITVAEYPSKLNYMDGDQFDPDGIKVVANGSDGSATDITALVSYDKTNLIETDTKVVVSYDGKTADILISVIGLNNHTHTYEGAQLTGTPATIFNEGLWYKECDFDGCNERVTGVIPAVEIVEIKVTKQPDATDYFVGDKFNPDGVVIIAVGADNSETDITARVSFDKETLVLTDTVVSVLYNNTVVAAIPVTVRENISVSEALKSENYDKTVAVVGIYVGVSDEGAGDDKEILLKDLNSDKLIAVRKVAYGSFPDYGYEYGDKVVITATVKRINYDASASTAGEQKENKTYLHFSETNPENILDTIVSRGNIVSFSLENIPVVDSWADMQSFFKGSIETYTYVRMSGKMYFNSFSSTGADKTLIHRLTMNENAKKIDQIKPDGVRAVGIRQVMLEANVPSSVSTYFHNAFGVMNEVNPDYPSEGSKSIELDFYAVVTCTNSVNYQLTILDPSWLLGRSETVKNEDYTQGDIVKEVAMAYLRQNTQMYYCDYWRNENVSPESATSQRHISLDCSSFVNGVYYEAFGVNVVPGALTSVGPKTELINNYAKEYLGKNPDVIGYWETADYPTVQEQKALLTDIYANLQPGDVVVYRRADIGSTESTSGHVMLYIGDGLFLESSGAINGANKTNPTALADKCSTWEITYGTVWRTGAANLFEKETSSYYLFRTTDTKYNVSFAVLRPLARNLTPTEKTVNRMSIAGISMEKTVSVGLDKAVLPGSLITYTLELENHSTSSYENILFEDTLSDKVSFVSGSLGITAEGNKITALVDVASMSKRVVSWTVRVNDDAVPGDKIVSDATYFGGVNVFTIENYVSRFTDSELNAFADEAREYADGTTQYTDPIDFVNKIYSEALGIELGLTSSRDVIASAFSSVTATTNVTIKTDGQYADMIIPYLQSGADLKAIEPHISVHSISDFMVGDIVVCRWLNTDKKVESFRVFIYVGDEQFVMIDTVTGYASVVDNGNENFSFSASATTKFTRKCHTVQFRSYGKCVVLRPTISGEIK